MRVQHLILFQTSLEKKIQMLQKLRKFDCKWGIYEEIFARGDSSKPLSYLNNITKKKKT
jgi:hypothetical protein